MPKCSFCGTEKKAFEGIHLIKNSGVIDYYCSRKCRINSQKLHRDKRRVRWTEAYRITKEKEIAKEAEESASEKVEEKVVKEVWEKQINMKLEWFILYTTKIERFE